MLARVAEKIYWLARYMERAENTARLINATTNLLIDLPKNASLSWEFLVQIMGSNSIFTKLQLKAEEQDVIRFLLEDENNPSSLLMSLRFAQENARQVREVLTPAAYEEIKDLSRYIENNIHHTLSRRKRFEFLQEVIKKRQTIIGISITTMSHDAIYQILRLGRNIERADMTTRIIDVSCADLLAQADTDTSSYKNLRWMSVLTSLSAYHAYRRRVNVQVNDTQVLSFLLKDKLFPRAVSACIVEITECIKNLPNNYQLLNSLKDFAHQLEKVDTNTLIQNNLHEYIDELQEKLANINELIYQNYFHLPPQS